jgi:hypothetical protein
MTKFGHNRDENTGRNEPTHRYFSEEGDEMPSLSLIDRIRWPDLPDNLFLDPLSETN